MLDALPDELTGAQRFAQLWARAFAWFALSRTQHAAEALREALALPDLSETQRLDLIDFAFLCDFNAGRNASALAHADAALAIARRTGNGVDLARSHSRRGMLLLAGNDTAGAMKALHAAADEAERLGIVHMARLSLYNLTVAYATECRHAEALAAAERGWNLEPPLDASDFR
jgi:tetratricopeptide (TPR) repeat protein